MTRLPTLMTLILGLAWALSGFSETASAQNSCRTDLSDASAEIDHGVFLINQWRYHGGDNFAWADPEFVDTLWEVIDSSLMPPNHTPADWNGNGWFRAWIKLDSSFASYQLGMGVRQMGALEVYFDGRLIHQNGRVGFNKEEEEARLCRLPQLISIDLATAGEHLIAIRYSHHAAQEYSQPFDYNGFAILVGPVGDVSGFIYEEMTTWSRRQYFFLGSALALTFLHLLLFLYYPSRRANLFLAVLTGSFAGLSYFPHMSSQVKDISDFYWYLMGFKASVIVCAVYGPRVLYEIFYSKLPRQFWLLFGCGALLITLLPFVTVKMVFIFTLLTQIEAFRVVVVALIRRKDAAWVIGIGYILFIMATRAEIFHDLGWIDSAHDSGVYLWGILALSASMSVYVARSVARVSQNLLVQLQNVSQLSDKNMISERRAREQEMKQKLLQQELEHNARQLAKAKELEEALVELAATNKHLKATQSQLVQSEKMASLGQLVAGVAHEINTPVGAVSSMHATLMTAINYVVEHLRLTDPKLTDAKLGRCLKAIEDADRVINAGTDRVTEIVRRLRSFARLDEAELKTVDIHEGIEDTLNLIHHDIKHGVEVIKEFGQLPALACFSGQLNQVFLNIMVNARQAMDGKGELTITTTAEEGWVKIRFQDTGKGIPPENLSKVFDPGFTTKGVGVGTGLGLSICYQIVADHQGEIAVASKLGQGTSFTITLPTDLERRLNNSGTGKGLPRP